MIKIFAEIIALKLLKNARTSLVNGDYAAVLDYSVQILNKLGYTSVAADIQAAIDAVGSGDKRLIAVASLNLILDLVNAFLGFGKPITVASAAIGVTDEAIAGRLDLAVDHIDHATAPSRGFTSATAISVDPQTILVAFQILQQVFSFFYSQLNKKQPAPTPVVVVAPPVTA